MSDNIPKYKATDKMSDLICENYTLLMVMSRFGLPLGFGDKNVKEVCDACNVVIKRFWQSLILWIPDNLLSEEQIFLSKH